MSGALALVARGTNIARGAMQSGAALARLFNGGAGALLSGAASGPLTLGGFAFADMELPESIQCGGQQQTAVHQFPGGGRTVDAMGPVEAPISWSGIFLGPDAATRSVQLSEMRRAGQVVPLAWGGTVVPVVVAEVMLDWRNPHWVPYRVTCTVLPPPPAKGADADDEDADLGDMDDESPGGGILGALGDAAGDVGGVLTDVANEAGRIVGIAQGALSAVNGVIGPVTSALGIQVPFLQTLSGGLAAASGIVSFGAAAGSGLSSFGASYGTQALSDLGQFNAGGFDAADGYTDAFDGAGIDIGATPATLADTTAAARDSAIGATSGAAINSAQVADRATVTSQPDAAIPAPPIPPSGGAAVPPPSAGDPSLAAPAASAASTAAAPPAPVPPPAAVPDVTPPPAAPPAPGNATTPPVPAGNAASSGDLDPATFTYAPAVQSQAPFVGSDAAAQGIVAAQRSTALHSGDPVQSYAQVQASNVAQSRGFAYGAETQATAKAAGLSDAQFTASLQTSYANPDYFKAMAAQGAADYAAEQAQKQ